MSLLRLGYKNCASSLSFSVPQNPQGKLTLWVSLWGSQCDKKQMSYANNHRGTEACPAHGSELRSHGSPT